MRCLIGEMVGYMQILFRRRNHKEEHFERLFAEMYPRLVRFATTLMSNTEEAKERNHATETSTEENPMAEAVEESPQEKLAETDSHPTLNSSVFCQVSLGFPHP